VEQIVARRGADLIFTYSRYEVAPPGLQAAAPRSNMLQVPACDVTPDWLADRFAELAQTKRWLALLGSNARASFSYPMIDSLADLPIRCFVK